MWVGVGSIPSPIPMIRTPLQDLSLHCTLDGHNQIRMHHPPNVGSWFQSCLPIQQPQPQIRRMAVVVAVTYNYHPIWYRPVCDAWPPVITYGDRFMLIVRIWVHIVPLGIVVVEVVMTIHKWVEVLLVEVVVLAVGAVQRVGIYKLLSRPNMLWNKVRYKWMRRIPISYVIWPSIYPHGDGPY